MMRRHTTQSPLDAETLAKMDVEFLAGKYDSIEVPPIALLDPASDPFGMSFEWLQEPSQYEAAYDRLRHAFPSEILINSARAFRAISQSESFASGTDDEVFKAWIRDRFIPLIRSSHPALFQTLLEAPEPSFHLTGEVIRVLRKESTFEAIPPNEQVLIAYAAVDHLRDEIKRSQK